MSQNEANAVFYTKKKGKCILLHLRLTGHPHQRDELATTDVRGIASGASAENHLDTQREARLHNCHLSRVPASTGFVTHETRPTDRRDQ